MSKEKFCHYCRRYKVDEGFKSIPATTRAGTTNQCTPCQERRRLSRSDHERMAAEEREARRVAESERVKHILKEKKIEKDFGNQ